MKTVNVDRIIYRNPLWTRGNIRHAKECGIQTVIIETEDDLKRFATYYPEASIILRVIMDRKIVSDPLTEDNFDVEKAISLLRATKDSSVRIKGVRYASYFLFRLSHFMNEINYKIKDRGYRIGSSNWLR